MLDGGADPNTALPGGETALMTAARTGDLGPVKALLARGADVNAKERQGQTALMWAAAEGHAGVVEALLAAGADFRTPLASGFTPLFFAVREGRTDVVRILLKAGADVNEAMQPERTRRQVAADGDQPADPGRRERPFRARLAAVGPGADPNDQRSGYGPLHTLTWVRKPNRGDGDDGQAPPTGSGRITSLQFVKELVEHGADVNLRLKKGPSGRAFSARPARLRFCWRP